MSILRNWFSCLGKNDKCADQTARLRSQTSDGIVRIQKTVIIAAYIYMISVLILNTKNEYVVCLIISSILVVRCFCNG